MRVFRYDSAQWTNEIFPLYQKMATYFTDHMWLAEQTTRTHHHKLVHFIDKWRRAQASILTADVSCELDFTDYPPNPLYDDLEDNFGRLRRLIRKT